MIGALFAPVYFLLLPSVGLQAGVTLTLRLARYIDWLGIISFAGFMCCFIMAITFGGSLYAWNSGAEIALWVVTGCLLVVFGLTQLVHPFVGPDDRLFPVGFLKSPTLLMLQTLTFISSMSLLVRILQPVIRYSLTCPGPNLLYSTIFPIREGKEPSCRW